VSILWGERKEWQIQMRPSIGVKAENSKNEKIGGDLK